MNDKCLSMDIFKKLNLRITKQRIAILDQIIENNHPFTVQYIYESLLHKKPSDLVTIYRFINLMHESGIIRIIAENDGKQYFEMACQHNPIHPHFICENCHKIFCLEKLSVDDFLRLASYTSNSQVNELKILLGGLCENCKKH